MEQTHLIVGRALGQDRSIGQPDTTGSVKIDLAAPRSPQNGMREVNHSVSGAAKLVKPLHDRVGLDVTEVGPG